MYTKNEVCFNDENYWQTTERTTYIKPLLSTTDRRDVRIDSGDDWKI